MPVHDVDVDDPAGGGERAQDEDYPGEPRAVAAGLSQVAEAVDGGGLQEGHQGRANAASHYRRQASSASLVELNCCKPLMALEIVR